MSSGKAVIDKKEVLKLLKVARQVKVPPTVDSLLAKRMKQAIEAAKKGDEERLRELARRHLRILREVDRLLASRHRAEAGVKEKVTLLLKKVAKGGLRAANAFLRVAAEALLAQAVVMYARPVFLTLLVVLALLVATELAFALLAGGVPEERKAKYLKIIRTVSRKAESVLS